MKMNINNNVNNEKKRMEFMTEAWNCVSTLAKTFLSRISRLHLESSYMTEALKIYPWIIKKTTILHKLCDSYIRLNFGRRFSGRIKLRSFVQLTE